MSLTSYIATIKKSLGSFTVPVREGPLDRFIAVHANSYREVILVSDEDGITSEPDDSLERPAVVYPFVVDVYVVKAPIDKDDEAIIRAREIFDDVFPALHGLEIDGFQVRDVEGGRIIGEDILNGHYQARFNLYVSEDYILCR